MRRSLYRRSLGEKISDAAYVMVCVIMGLILASCAVIFFSIAWTIVEETKW